jgi:hypothetical protein
MRTLSEKACAYPVSFAKSQRTGSIAEKARRSAGLIYSSRLV